MKKLMLLSLAVGALMGFTACSDDDDKPVVETGKAVTVTAEQGGKAAADVEKAEPGDKVTVTATPDEGYAFVEWIVEKGDISLTDPTAAKTWFIMPKAEVSIKATFKDVSQFVADVLPSITDPVFKAYCIQRMNNAQFDKDGVAHPKWDTDGDGKLSSDEAALVDWISIPQGEDDKQTSEEQIESMAGIEYFTGLKYLDLYMNAIEQIDLSKNVGLQYLNVGYNPLTEIDLSANVALQEFIGNDTYIKELAFTSHPALEKIDVNYADDLVKIDLPGCSKLINLNINHTGVKQVDFSKLPSLEVFDGGSCPLEGKMDFSKNPKMKAIYIFPRKSIFGTTRGKVTEIDVTKCPELKVLQCNTNQLTYLDVTHNPNLYNLQVIDNGLTSLDVSKCPELYYLYAQLNDLTALDVTKNTKLLYCQVYANHIQEFDASHLAFLFDEKKQEYTNAYDLWVGCQRLPTTAKDKYQEFSPQKNPELFYTVKVKIRKDMKPFWDSNLYEVKNVHNYYVALEYVD